MRKGGSMHESYQTQLKADLVVQKFQTLELSDTEYKISV